APARLRPALLSATSRLTSGAHAEAEVGGRSRAATVLDLETGFCVADADQQVPVRHARATALASQPTGAALHAVLRAGRRRERAAGDPAALRRVVRARLLARTGQGIERALRAARQAGCHYQQTAAENEAREHLSK